MQATAKSLVPEVEDDLSVVIMQSLFDCKPLLPVSKPQKALKQLWQRHGAAFSGYWSQFVHREQRVQFLQRVIPYIPETPNIDDDHFLDDPQLRFSFAIIPEISLAILAKNEYALLRLFGERSEAIPYPMLEEELDLVKRVYEKYYHQDASSESSQISRSSQNLSLHAAVNILCNRHTAILEFLQMCIQRYLEMEEDQKREEQRTAMESIPERLKQEKLVLMAGVAAARGNVSRSNPEKPWRIQDDEFLNNKQQWSVKKEKKWKKYKPATIPDHLKQQAQTLLLDTINPFRESEDKARYLAQQLQNELQVNQETEGIALLSLLKAEASTRKSWQSDYQLPLASKEPMSIAPQPMEYVSNDNEMLNSNNYHVYNDDIALASYGTNEPMQSVPSIDPPSVIQAYSDSVIQAELAIQQMDLLKMKVQTTKNIAALTTHLLKELCNTQNHSNNNRNQVVMVEKQVQAELDPNVSDIYEEIKRTKWAAEI